MKDISYDILELMKTYGSDEEGIRTILETRTEPEILMALSPIRENLVEWLDISSQDSVLEIGSDYGALTGVLARKAKEVLVLDSQAENLEVNKIRNQWASNIRYQDTEKEELQGQKFDWVLLIGLKTWEVEQGIEGRKKTWNHKMEEQKYAIEKIQQAASRVKDGGRMVLALPNSQAMRIWAGKENDKDELALSYADLKEILTLLRGKKSRFYYPLPDYRLPSAIYSDDYLPAKGELPSLFAEYEKPRYRLFSEEAAYDALCEAGGFVQFANSFLVIWEK